jgi:mRNA-degrading endonuclease RelE of RelBE toxin-antitoxin system/DNA-binding XRE family transcriptional regulator
VADVRLTSEAQEQFRALPRTIQARVTMLLERLEKWPAVSGAKPLRGAIAGVYRLRTGDYRLQFHARATIARNLIRDRVAARLTQRELAKLAGVPVETLCRIETGQRTPSVPTIDKIDRALKKIETPTNGRKPRKQRAR